MEKTEMNCNRGSAPLFFLTGLGAGIALTVLLAPRAGAATRRLIGQKVEEGKDWMKDKATVAQDYVRGHGEELRDRVEEGKDWMKDKATVAQDYVRGQGEELRDRVKEVAEVIERN